jgi:hypothetical protein
VQESPQDTVLIPPNIDTSSAVGSFNRAKVVRAWLEIVMWLDYYSQRNRLSLQFLIISPTQFSHRNKSFSWRKNRRRRPEDDCCQVNQRHRAIPGRYWITSNSECVVFITLCGTCFMQIRPVVPRGQDNSVLLDEVLNAKAEHLRILGLTPRTYSAGTFYFHSGCVFASTTSK